MTPITTPLKSNRIEDIVQEWYADFVNVEQIMLFELVTAANFMDIKALLDLTCLAVSVLIKVSALLFGHSSFFIGNNMESIAEFYIPFEYSYSPRHHFAFFYLCACLCTAVYRCGTGEISRRNP